MSYYKTGKIKLGTYDRKWSKVVRLRDNYTCQVCGLYDTHYVSAHHFIGRTNKRLRFEPLNGISLCAKHHTFNNNFSAHRTPKDFKRWFLDRFKYLKKRENEKMTERQAVKEFKERTER